MQTALLHAGVAVYGIAHLLAGVLAAVAYIGGWVFFVLNGAVVWVIIWAIFGTVAVLLAVSVLRFPFVVMGWALAALGGRTEDYWEFVRQTNRR